MSEETTQSQQTEEQTLSLKPTISTYLRYLGVILSDVVAVYGLYQTFDLYLAIILSVIVVILTIIAAWKNNSLTKGACAADFMKDTLKDVTTRDEITGVWTELRKMISQVYQAVKTDIESKNVTTVDTNAKKAA